MATLPFSRMTWQQLIQMAESARGIVGGHSEPLARKYAPRPVRRPHRKCASEAI